LLRLSLDVLKIIDDLFDKCNGIKYAVQHETLFDVCTNAMLKTRLQGLTMFHGKQIFEIEDGKNIFANTSIRK
jgi:hypothetical protein